MKPIGYIMVTAKFYKEGKKWVAICNELGTSTFGYTLMEAQKKLSEAVICHLQTLIDVGEFVRFFKEHKIPIFKHMPREKEITVAAPLDSKTFVQPLLQKVSHEKIYAVARAHG